MAPMPFFAAFRRVFNLRMVAAVFYFCLLYAGSRAMFWWGHESTGAVETFFELTRFTRQTLLTGFAMLLAIAVAEGVLASRPWPRAGGWAIQGLAVALGGCLGTWARYRVAAFYDPEVNLMLGWFLSTISLWTVLGGLAFALLRLLRAEHETAAHLRRLEREREALRERDAEAQVSALNAQIEPHFLFNTLANVKRLYETQPERGRDMLAALINYLRAALPGMRAAHSTLGTELELVRHYLAILQMRMGARLHFSIEADGDLLGQALPPMVLPTLVENAIKHGLSPLPEGGRIDIGARRVEAGWAIEVRDDGQGFAPSSSGTGVGLANTRARLAALFGERARLELEAGTPRGVVARVMLPAL
jgi:hypothetical protein